MLRRRGFREWSTLSALGSVDLPSLVETQLAGCPEILQLAQALPGVAPRIGPLVDLFS